MYKFSTYWINILLTWTRRYSGRWRSQVCTLT